MLKPLNENVIVEVIEVERRTASGILLSSTSVGTTRAEGIVVAVGSGRLLENGQRAGMSVAIGDKVIYNYYSQDDAIIYDDKKIVVINEADILAVVEGNK